MPLPLPPPAPGSTYRVRAHLPRLFHFSPGRSLRTLSPIAPYSTTYRSPLHCPPHGTAPLVPIASLPSPNHPSRLDGEPTQPDAEDSSQHVTTTTSTPPLRRHIRRISSRNVTKARQQSPSALLLDAIHGPARSLYASPGERDTKFSPIDLPWRRTGGRQSKRTVSRSLSRAVIEHVVTEEEQPLSLYSLLAQYLRAITISPWGESDFKFTDSELCFLKQRGFSQQSVERWASSLLDRASLPAAENFVLESKAPPVSLILLFLRRKRMTQAALGVMMRHVDHRLQFEPITWTALKTLIMRMVRHARVLWPESMPWITSLFTREATRICGGSVDPGRLSVTMLSDLTQFCNALLVLLSIPTSIQPIISSLRQQNAQFQVLRFMASPIPALIVNRTGFRAIVRTQLAHPKTPQEREWARLKGTSWPPWMHERTAMDEGKGYEFGASRASRIMHRMYDAGYKCGQWEQLAEIYAGWDTDLSPTIQTRTSFPNVFIRETNRQLFRKLIWAGRIRTTRTRREAWACFLACEASTTTPSQEVYYAMFEKLHYPEVKVVQQEHADAVGDTEGDNALLPGDILEVWPEPKSPMDLVYIAEPVPSFEQLYHRMRRKDIRPTGRFLAFLIETSSEFTTALELLESAKDDFGGAVLGLLDASQLDGPPIVPLPNYVFTAFIRFLCKFGRYTGSPGIYPIAPSSQEHELRFKSDQHYLLEYAYALLIHVRPHHRPAWTTYMEKLLFQPWSNKGYQERGRSAVQYRIICELVEKMGEENIDLDEQQFRLVCTALRYAAQSAFRGQLAPEDARYIITTGPRHLRTQFHTLVSANVGPNPRSPASTVNPIPPYVPGPVVLHAYVRALGILRDYEGIYSFTTWAKNQSVDVTARARGQHSGPKALRRTLIAVRAALDGVLEAGQDGAPEDIVQLVKSQVVSVEEWGGWPSDEEVELYSMGRLRR